MSRKKNISDEAFPSVRDTSEEKKNYKKKEISKKKILKPAEIMKTIVKRSEYIDGEIQKPSTRSQLQHYSDQTVLVQFNPKGEIIMMTRVESENHNKQNILFKKVHDLDVAELKIPIDLVDKSLCEIHSSCRVCGIDSTLYLSIKEQSL